MTARDDLIELLTNAALGRNEWEQSEEEAQADAILAAGWTPPPKPKPAPPPGVTPGLVTVTKLDGTVVARRWEW